MLRGIGFSNALKRFEIFLIFIILIMILTLFPLRVLVAEDFKSHDFLKLWKAKDGQEFTIRYIHSVEKSPVTEKYKVSKDHIVLLETEFKSYGAGLPATTKYEFEITEYGFRIYNIDEIYESVIYRTGAEIANHKIIINEKSYEFLDFSKKRTGVEFSIQKISFFQYIKLILLG